MAASCVLQVINIVHIVVHLNATARRKSLVRSEVAFTRANGHAFDADGLAVW